MREVYLVEIKMQKGNKIAAAERERRAGKPENIDERIRKRNDKLLKFQKFSQKNLES